MSFSIGHCKTRPISHCTEASRQATAHDVGFPGLLFDTEWHMTGLESRKLTEEAAGERAQNHYPQPCGHPSLPCSGIYRLLRTHPHLTRPTQRLWEISIPSQSVTFSPISLSPNHAHRRAAKAGPAPSPGSKDSVRGRQTSGLPPRKMCCTKPLLLPPPQESHRIPQDGQILARSTLGPPLS